MFSERLRRKVEDAEETEEERQKIMKSYIVKLVSIVEQGQVS